MKRTPEGEAAKLRHIKADASYIGEEVLAILAAAKEVVEEAT